LYYSELNYIYRKIFTGLKMSEMYTAYNCLTLTLWRPTVAIRVQL